MNLLSKKSKVLLLPLFFLPFFSNAQSIVKIGTQIPLQYTIGYEYQFHKRWSGTINGGVLTKPYDALILDVLKAFGTDPSIVNVLANAFSFGLVAQGGVNYHFKKSYVGVNFSLIYLKAADTPVSAVESAFNVSIASYPFKFRQNNNPVSVTLGSDLYAAGILYGRRFFIKNPMLELRTEIGFSKVIGSASYVESVQRSLESLSKLVDQELNSIYIDYGYIPTLNVYLVYKLGQSKK